MPCPKAVIFDLDETLAPSFQPPTDEMSLALSALIERIPTAIMSGAGFDRIERDLVSRLRGDLARLSIFPNSSAECFLRANSAWRQEYSHLLGASERAHIRHALEEALVSLPELTDAPQYGERIIDREAQIAFTAIGIDAPPDIKAAWDPDASKRLAVARYLRDVLPDFTVLIGGSTTIDITRKDTNKSTGVRWYARYLGVATSDMLYVGDSLFPGGNDEVVIPTGVQTKAVGGPIDTLAIIRNLLITCAG